MKYSLFAIDFMFNIKVLLFFKLVDIVYKIKGQITNQTDFNNDKYFIN